MRRQNKREERAFEALLALALRMQDGTVGLFDLDELPELSTAERAALAKVPNPVKTPGT